MHDDVGTVEHLTQIGDGVGPCQVERAPVGPLVDALLSRGSAHHSDDVVLGGECTEQGGSDVATCSGDDDAHGGASGSFGMESTFVGDAFEVNAQRPSDHRGEN
jgi:hypothetical protein